MNNTSSPATPANQIVDPNLEQKLGPERQPTMAEASQILLNPDQLQLSFQQQQTGSMNRQSESTTVQAGMTIPGQQANVTINDTQQTRQHAAFGSQLPDPHPNQIQSSPPIKPLLNPEIPNPSDHNPEKSNEMTTSTPNNKEQQSQKQPSSPQKAIVTKVKLTDELNVFDWFRTKDIIYQIAEKAKNSVDSVITVLDPGMKEYLYSGGYINIIVISDSRSLVSPIRDAFQSVFGRATVAAAKYNSPQSIDDYPVKLGFGFNEAIIVAKERIKKFRLATSTVPQNQVILVVQPTLVAASKTETQCLKLDENVEPQWFLTFCIVIEDPVLGLTMNSYSQFIPIDPDIVVEAKRVQFPPDFPNPSLGSAQSIRDLMTARLELSTDESIDRDLGWLKVWSGLDEESVIHDLSISLAHMYRRKWKEIVIE